MKGLLVTYAITGGGSAAAIFNPVYGLMAYVALAIIKPEAMWPWTVGEGRYSLLVAASMFLGWIMTNRATFSFGRAFPVAAMMFGFLAWSYFGAYFPPNQFLAWDYVERIAKIIIPLLVGLTLITSTRELKMLAWTIVIAQGYVAFELNSYYFSGYNVLQYEGFGGMDNNSAAIALVTGSGIAFFLGLNAEKLWQKGLAFGLCLFMAHAVLFSFSRGGALGLLVTGIAIAVVIPKTPKTWGLLLVTAIMASVLAGPEVRARFMTAFSKQDGQREASAQSRVDLWKDCWDVMTKRPIMGIGPNHWPEIAADYGWPHGKEAHSLWMQTGAELGFVGLSLYLGYYLLCIFQLWMLTWKSTVVEDEWYKHTARMALAGLCGFVVSASFVSIEALEIPYYTALLGCGALKLASAKRTVAVFDEESIPATEPRLAMV